MKIYTRKGDEGETGLLYGDKVSKNSVLPEAYGTVDEAQAILGLVRTECEKGSDLENKIIHIERDLYVLMAELATDPSNHSKLVSGKSKVNNEMIQFYEALKEFDIMANSDDYQWKRVLKPGELLIFNNWRVLHGRSLFKGSRKMSGCYINKEDFDSCCRMNKIIF